MSSADKNTMSQLPGLETTTSHEQAAERQASVSRQVGEGEKDPHQDQWDRIEAKLDAILAGQAAIIAEQAPAKAERQGMARDLENVSCIADETKEKARRSSAME